MKILFFGDVVGRPGREALTKIIPKFKKKFEPDLILANGENLSHGKGITQKTFDEVLKAGVDLITSGNHIFAQKEAISLLENEKNPLIRPANYSRRAPGQGFKIIEIITKKILVVNLLGRVFMRHQYDDPFEAIDEILNEFQLKREVDAILIDWHAEATSEKQAMGWHLDGRVSAVIGTHTHIMTDDAKVLPQGTAYISDVGMVGPRDSVLGIDKEAALKGFLTQMPQKMELAPGPVEANAILIEIDKKTGLSKNIKKIQETIDISN